MNRRILYVDDDAANLVVFEAACNKDFDVRIASGADEALAILRREEIAVLLTDQRMPGVTGVQLAAKVRAEYPDIVCLLVTAFADLDSTIDAINRGHVHRYLRKPWDVRELKSAIEEALELQRLRVEMRALQHRLLETERVFALGVCAASIGHELRNPIGWLTATLTLARETLRETIDRSAGIGEAPPQLVDSLEDIDKELADAQLGAKRILDIVQGIDMPMRVRGKQEDVDVADVIRTALQIVRGEFRGRSQLEIDLQPTPKVRGSSTELGQVVLNLIVNALQALPERPAAENVVAIHLSTRDGWVCLEVEDNGKGIPASVIGKIFDPFFTTDKTGGTGLGLAISKRIVQELGGNITVESVGGIGTKLQVLLPPAP